VSGSGAKRKAVEKDTSHCDESAIQVDRKTETALSEDTLSCGDGRVELHEDKPQMRRETPAETV